MLCFDIDSLLPSAVAKSGKKQNKKHSSQKNIKAGIVGKKLTGKYAKYSGYISSYGPRTWIEKAKGWDKVVSSKLPQHNGISEK